MRIGIDMLAVQSENRHRGIGRIGRELTSTLIGLDRGTEFLLYAHAGLPTDFLPRAENARLASLDDAPGTGRRTPRAAVERLAAANPDALDLLLILSPFENHPHYAPPARAPGGLPLAAIVYDLIPFVFQERYLSDPTHARRAYKNLATLRQYDALLAISESARDDALRLIGIRPERVVNVRSASFARNFAPDRSLPMTAEARGVLGRFGIRGPFVFHVGGMDERKNHWGLIDAFALLPPALRRSLQLVITCHVTEAYAGRIRNYARERGVADRLVLTGEITDDAVLCILYQRCDAFALPSHYEGFGLPLLEAMLCGAPVLAGANSSQPEVIGPAGLAANSHDAADVALKLARILEDGELAKRLRAEGPRRAAEFSWESTAGIALDALRSAARPPSTGRRGFRPKPRLAIFSPWPPKGSGISDYSTRLAEELRSEYAIDLYHEPGYVPEPGLSSADFGSYDWRLFARRDRVQGYRGVLHQMGNSFYHGFVFEAMIRHGGIVALHDFCLSGFQFWRAHVLGGDPFQNLRGEVAYNYPDRFAEYEPQLRGWTEEKGGFQEALARRGLYLNRRVFESAEGVIVHSPWCLDQAARLDPAYAGKTVVIPHGSEARLMPAGRRAATRDRFGLPRDAFIVGSYGILTQAKMNVEAILAFQALARRDPKALFILVGQDWENGEARTKVAELGLADRVRFLGRQPAEAFDDLLAVADLGLSLRRPPTYGETSGALLHLLRNGIPTIVTDVATFADYPDTIVRKIRWPDEGQAGLDRAVLDLATDATARETLGAAAHRYVLERHAWPKAAALYAEAIERARAERVRRRGAA